MRVALFSTCLLVILGNAVKAQLTGNGELSGSFETNSILYRPDSRLNVAKPDDNVGSNNYFRLDYRNGKFSAGLMYEAYLPVLQGLPAELKGQQIAFKYASFQDKDLNITVGDFYEQFGSGLIFRAYEERALGLNNSLEGVKLSYRLNEVVSFKGIYGRPRKYMERANAQVRGLDVSLQLNNALGWSETKLSVEGSYLNKYENYTGTSVLVSPNVTSYSFRAGVEQNSFALKTEYVYKSADPAVYNNNVLKEGNALLVEAGYNANGTGVLLTGRRLEYMDLRSSRETVGIGEVLNYLPSLTRQYTYSLANLNPYATQGNGEIGGQLDFYHNFKKGSFIGGATGLKLSANFSTYYNLKGDLQNGYEMFAVGSELLYRDFNIDLVKNFGKKLRTTLLFSNQTFNPLTIGKASNEFKSNILIGDILYKLSARKSLRLEMQHLWSQDDHKNWASGTLEFNMAPSWSVFASDMYNYGGTEIHYYNGGFSYAKSRTRFALSYGRNREGYQCVGGVCRLMPAYTGFNLSLTSSF